MNINSLSFSRTLQDLATLLSNAAALHTLLCIFYYKGSMLPELLLWWGLLILYYAAVQFLFHITTYRQPAFAGVILLPAMQLAALIHGGTTPDKTASMLLILLLWFIPAARTCTLGLKPATPEQRMLDFEAALLVLILTVLLVSTNRFPAQLLISSLGSVLLALFALVLQRTTGHSGRFSTLEPLLLMLLPCMLVLLAAGFSLWVAAPLTAAVRLILLGVLALLTTMLQQINHFLFWFFSLFPATRPVAMKLEPTEHIDMNAADTSALFHPDLTVPLLLLILITAALCLLMQLRRYRASTVTSAAQRTVISHISLWQRLQTGLRRLRTRLLLEWYTLTARNTPAGLFLYIRRLLASCGHRQSPSQTCRDYLLSHADCFPNCEKELTTLADWLDACYFSAQIPQIDPSQIAVVRKKLIESFPK